MSVYQSNADWNTLNLKDTYEQTMNTKYATFTHDFPVDFVAANGRDAMEAYVGKSTYKVTQPTKVQKILKMTKLLQSQPTRVLFLLVHLVLLTPTVSQSQLLLSSLITR